ncbi:uncharacterized protein E0L32_009025 [Thyridium curvatum]|uniref:Carboxylic ester hydrolase n=1 Tax=Thyridium curvatum TaxID=1093900 RepID=A0A507ATL6_9PEZI|nr:uncharacterized protein E0L32_009025 [Thyridium curvatum]TPX09834.1 hypothetical protein E0L32_009025 [Thyridium curvatum]
MLSLFKTVAFLATVVSATLSTSSLNTDLTILINNDLQGADSKHADSGFILLSKRTFAEAVETCEALGEQLWAPELNLGDIRPNLDYLIFQGATSESTTFWIGAKDGKARAATSRGMMATMDPDERMKALCTHSAPYSTAAVADTSEKWQLTVTSSHQDITGFRDRHSFRFLGVRYAPQPDRFAYSVPFKGNGSAASATGFAPQCVQSGSGGSEDCLFLNIWTPYVPRPESAAKKNKQKPVMFWIHGGAFTGGTGSDPTFDGGNLASRGAVVVVTINYRLSTLGFLALDDGVTKGNYGLADQINALDWVRAHIQDFGGNPDKLTVFGQSAGAGSVRALMASPMAVGKFAGAIMLSNLGGINYGTTYSKYYTIPEEVEVAAKPILKATNCTDAPSQVECLRAVPAATLAELDTVARYIVVDGKYILQDQLRMAGPRQPYELMMGITAEDGAPFISYPKTADRAAYLEAAGFPNLPEHVFPVPEGPDPLANLFNMSSRLATDGIFRCVDQDTAYSGLKKGKFGPVYYYEFDRTYQPAGWPDLAACEPPKSTSHPHGDPSLPYLRCHSGELYYVFGNLARQGLPVRDEADLPFEQFVVDSFSSFARTFNPNPERGLLSARRYEETLQEIEKYGLWMPATPDDMTLRVLQWPTSRRDFGELEQCDALGLGYDYYG